MFLESLEESLFVRDLKSLCLFIKDLGFLFIKNLESIIVLILSNIMIVFPSSIMLTFIVWKS